MQQMSRRDLFRNGAVAGAAVVLSGEFLDLLAASPAGAAPLGGFGPLVPDPAGKLDLPEGFTYSIVARSGLWGQDPYNESFDVLDDAGHPPFPTKADGTGAFVGRKGGTILVQNHEQDAVSPGAQFLPLTPKDTGAPVYDGSATNAFGHDQHRVDARACRCRSPTPTAPAPRPTDSSPTPGVLPRRHVTQGTPPGDAEPGTCPVPGRRARRIVIPSPSVIDLVRRPGWRNIGGPCQSSRSRRRARWPWERAAEGAAETTASCPGTSTA